MSSLLSTRARPRGRTSLFHSLRGTCYGFMCAWYCWAEDKHPRWRVPRTSQSSRGASRMSKHVRKRLLEPGSPEPGEAHAAYQSSRRPELAADGRMDRSPLWSHSEAGFPETSAIWELRKELISRRLSFLLVYLAEKQSRVDKRSLRRAGLPLRALVSPFQARRGPSEVAPGSQAPVQAGSGPRVTGRGAWHTGQFRRCLARLASPLTHFHIYPLILP